ncbi:hypothetical protein RRG08_020443 [Elysia crispata]|uniref:Secreted protein n=1 Tax=Elysia crispata TaxID=231223 RepID=A0AAE1EBB1_9GAST|nr:hypothetical protein RRG08_020443 [Elysia crispata]
MLIKRVALLVVAEAAVSSVFDNDVRGVGDTPGPNNASPTCGYVSASLLQIWSAVLPVSSTRVASPWHSLKFISDTSSTGEKRNIRLVCLIADLPAPRSLCRCKLPNKQDGGKSDKLPGLSGLFRPG